MAEILQVYTPEQLVELAKNRIIADNVGLTNFNIGSRIRSILEAVAAIESATGMDYLEGLRKAIPVSLYDGLGFKQKTATKASGYLRFYRLPALTLRYTGSGTSCLLTVTDLGLSTTVTGAGGDDLSLSFVIYTSVSALVTAINGHGSYTAVLVGSGSVLTTSLYDMAGVEIMGATNYLNQAGLDLMTAPAGQIILNSGLQASIDGIIFITTAAGDIPIGAATSAPIAAQAAVTGTTGNIAVAAIDTRNGKGMMNSPVAGVEYVVNDSAFSGGQDAETEEERAVRFQAYIQGLSRNTAKGIEAAVLEINEIRSVTVRENYPARGYLTVIADDGTGSLSTALRDEIQKVLYGDPDDIEHYPGVRPAGITANVDAPVLVPVNVTATVTRVGTLSDTVEITANVKTAIENYVNTLRLGRDVIHSELTRIAKSAHPSVYDVVVSVPAANVSINDSSVARTGSGTGAAVTVNITTISVYP